MYEKYLTSIMQKRYKKFPHDWQVGVITAISEPYVLVKNLHFAYR